MKKTALLAAAIIFSFHFSFFNSAQAEPVTPQRAATVAANFMRSRLSSKAPMELTLHISDWHYNGIYLFEREGGGWVLVATDDNIKPILGYSLSGTLDPANLPPALRQWLNGYEEQYSALCKAHASKQPIAIYPDDSAAWKRLEWPNSESMSGTKEGNGVAPLITSHWNQQYPYDQFCPAGCVTGCAATALAMYMKFWSYPAFGCGSYSYNPPRTGTTESADFGHTLYDWAHMPDETLQYYGDSVAISAVATLMYHCGVGMAMDYGTAESGGSAAIGIIGIPGYASMDNALKDYFHYSRSMQACFKDYGYTNDSWRALLMAELDEGRPILYGGAATQGGHAFICDGYDEQQYMHFNFGWSGIGDGYYPVDSISPGVGGVGGNVTYTFNQQNSCLIGAVPDYALHISDTFFSFMADGGVDSLLVGINEQSSDQLSIVTTADWLQVEPDSIGRAGWLRLQVATMAEGEERVAYIVLTQGEESDSVKVVQVNYNEAEMCELTVVMENTNSHYTGWDAEAYLSLESPNGFVFGTARLVGSDRDSVTVRVAPKDVRCVWHSGGGTDRYVNYWVRNLYGEDLVAVENAYRNGGDNLISWPCVHLAIEDSPLSSLPSPLIYPNPAYDKLTIQAEGVRQVEIIDITGRKMMETSHNNVDISQLPRGQYFVRITTDTTTSVKRFVKK